MQPEPSSPALPNKWEDITNTLDFTKTSKISDLILSASFLAPFVLFRDHLPLTPGMRLKIQPTSKSAMADITYAAMESLAASIFDRPSISERETWSPAQHLQCLVYQVCRNLARPNELFHEPFRTNTILSRILARKRICGIIMLCVNLAYQYTKPSLPLWTVIRRIEELHPSLHPENSPLEEVRWRAKVEKMDLEELRRMVLEEQRKAEGVSDEREWLVRRLLGSGKGKTGDSIESSNGGGKAEEASAVDTAARAGGKRKRDESEKESERLRDVMQLQMRAFFNKSTAEQAVRSPNKKQKEG